jgi:hypothetical protein
LKAEFAQFARNDAAGCGQSHNIRAVRGRSDGSAGIGVDTLGANRYATLRSGRTRCPRSRLPDVHLASKRGEKAQVIEGTSRMN